MDFVYNLKTKHEIIRSKQHQNSTKNKIKIMCLGQGEQGLSGWKIDT